MQQTEGVFYILKTAILDLTCLFGKFFLFNKPKSICNGRFLKWHFLLWSLPLFYFHIIFDWYIFANWGLFIDSQTFQCTIEEMSRGLPNRRRRYPLASEHRDRHSLFLLPHHHPPMMAVAEVEVNQTIWRYHLREFDFGGRRRSPLRGDWEGQDLANLIASSCDLTNITSWLKIAFTNL